MPMPRVSEARKVAPAAINVAAATLLVLGFGVSGTHERSLRSQASSWQGLVGGPRPQVTVARATSRPERRLRDSAAGARVDPRCDRLAESALGAAEHPRDPGAG